MELKLLSDEELWKVYKTIPDNLSNEDIWFVERYYIRAQLEKDKAQIQHLIEQEKQDE